MDPEPPQPLITLAAALVPALAAAGYAIVGATASSLSSGRKAALRDSLNGVARAALDRYLDAEERIETRWLVTQALGLGATATLLSWKLAAEAPTAALLGWLCSVLLYVVPVEIGRHYSRPRAERLLPSLLRAARIGEWLVAPLADPLYFLSRWLFNTSAINVPSATLIETEVELLVNEGELNGSLAHDQSEMIRNVLDFGDVSAEELMVPRIQIDGLEGTLTLSELQEQVSKTQHSRYPVYFESIDNIIGILHVKNLFHAIAQGEENKRAKDLARKPVAFIPEGQPASTVLKEMRAGRHHMAVVVDEFGGVSGILTLEDLLEEIVGDIRDEHDHDEAFRIRMLAPNVALVDASTPVADVNRTLGTHLPEGDYVSLGGLLLEYLGCVPPQGSTHELLGLHVLIRESDARRIARVELSGVPGVPRALTSPPPASSAEDSLAD